MIVSTARSAVVDEAVMPEALEFGKLASVGLDVFEEQKAISEKLMKKICRDTRKDGDFGNGKS